MNQPNPSFRDRDYWIVENTLYAEASFRLRKCARLIDEIAGSRKCSLLDVGCGPAALQSVLNRNIDYYGIDIAIHAPAANLREVNLADEPIAFNGKRFDFIVAMGLFEYMGHQQRQKLQEIWDILREDGKFVLSYINFGHLQRKIWPNYNNVQSTAEMIKALSEFFQVERHFPASHHWRQKQPGKYSLPSLQMHVNFRIPIFSSMLAVENFFICSPLRKPITALK
jgi:SAM-dependent methyltransferase